MEDSASHHGGGFVQPPLSPPPSSVASSAANGPLPRPRHQPLKPGSTKESTIINTIDERILHISRSFANKQVGPGLQSVDDQASFHGYRSFKEVARDVTKVVDLVWVSGTPTLQISYLISLAMQVLMYIPAFPPSPRSMFRLLRKLDYAFASLLQGRDLESGDQLPGMGMGRGVSPTERVRIKSLVERTRVVVVETLNSKDFEVTEVEDSDDEVPAPHTEDEDAPYDVNDLGEDDSMQTARVYDKTLMELGDTVGGPEIGIPTH